MDSEGGTRGGVSERSSSGRRLIAGVLLSVLSGTLLVLAAPQHGFAWLVLVGGVPMLVAQFYVLPARLAGLATAITYGIAGWGTLAVLAGDAVEPIVVRGGLVLLVLAAGVFGRVQRLLWDMIDYRWWILAAPLGWGVLATARLRMPVAGTDGFLVHSLFRHPAVLQPVSVIGVVGLAPPRSTPTYAERLGRTIRNRPRRVNRSVPEARTLSAVATHRA